MDYSSLPQLMPGCCIGSYLAKHSRKPKVQERSGVSLLGMSACVFG
jgi:hypothetical protein